MGPDTPCPHCGRTPHHSETILNDSDKSAIRALYEAARNADLRFTVKQSELINGLMNKV